MNLFHIINKLLSFWGQITEYICEILLQFKTIFYLNIFKNVIYSCDGKAVFSASWLQSSVSHDPSEIILICWFAAQETFPNVENSA